jgi:cold shock CspA family protein
MHVPLRITFRHLEPSAAIEAQVREKAAKLERFAEYVTGCHVVIEAPHRRHHQGNLFHVTIDLTLPGGEVVVNRQPQLHQAHEDAHVALRDAFDAAVRQVEDHVRRRRMDVKHHEESPAGHVARLFPEKGYGFIETPDGRDVYFHRNSVLDGAFDALQVGQGVRFVEELGEDGPQASSVHVVERRRPAP